MYEAAGAQDALEIFVQPVVDHRETPEMHEKVLAFLERELRAATRRSLDGTRGDPTPAARVVAKP
jgi:hypothetical protein